jgi:hypothetical protein
MLQTEIYENFGAKGGKIDMFCGVQTRSKTNTNLTADENGCLHFYLSYDPDTVAGHTLTKAEMQDLYTLEVGTTSNAKEKAFSQKYWSSRIWNFEETERLISLNFGYIPSVARIYTADDFVESSEGMYMFGSDDLYATDFENVYSVILMYNGSIVQNLTYSVGSYVYSMQNKSNSNGSLSDMARLTRALWNYGQSAKAYMEAK